MELIKSCISEQREIQALLLGCLDASIAIFSVHIYYMIASSRRRSSEYDARVSNFCLSCTDVQRHPDDILVGIDVLKNGTECCARNVSNLQHLVERYTGQWFKEFLYKENYTYTGCPNYRRSYARFRTKPPDKQYIKLVGISKSRRQTNGHINWHLHTGFKSRQIMYHNGYIHIRVSGIYYIYSQVALHFRSGTNRNSANQRHVSHTVAVKRRNSGEKGWTIMSANSTKSSYGVIEDLAVSFVGTSYLLLKGDRVFVKLSPHANILSNFRMNFFGLHMM